MKYLVRLNKKAFNPVTKQVKDSVIWEVEQAPNRDSEAVIWHCSAVKIDGVGISAFFEIPKPGAPAWEIERFGIATRGQDNAIEIRTGKADASGN